PAASGATSRRRRHARARSGRNRRSTWLPLRPDTSGSRRGARCTPTLWSGRSRWTGRRRLLPGKRRAGTTLAATKQGRRRARSTPRLSASPWAQPGRRSGRSTSWCRPDGGCTWPSWRPRWRR
ncbi:unnamed protein product, partial [Ectocarpus fasciculatus]